MSPNDETPRSLFPIPAKELAREMGRHLFWSPATWCPLACASVASLYSRSRIGALVATAVAILGVTIYWISQWTRLKKVARREAILNRIDLQNDALHYRASTLKQQLCEDDAHNLGRFISLKITMENAILRSGEFTSETQKTKTLIDTICFDVADELQRLADIRNLLWKREHHITEEEREPLERTEREIQDQVDSAYQALAAMQQQLETMLAPHQPASAGVSNLAETIAEVREETEIARRVRQRIEADELASIISEPTESDIQATPDDGSSTTARDHDKPTPD